jgi:hypothetical protein
VLIHEKQDTKKSHATVPLREKYTFSISALCLYEYIYKQTNSSLHYNTYICFQQLGSCSDTSKPYHA